MNDNNYKYLVAIRCMTFQHADYITDALNGFCMQQTEFPYVCMVVDDASTDGEQNVIREYIAKHFVVSETRAIVDGLGEYVIAKHKKNANCDLVYVELSQNLYRERERKLSLIRLWQEMAKYEALCEGDDYWTDPLKLQKQVNYMESHPEYVMCYHNAWQIWDNTKELFIDSQKKDSNVGLGDLLTVWCVPTASILYRRDVEMNVPRLAPHPNGDYCLELRLKSCGEIHYDPAVMSVYRMHGDSVSAGMNRNKVKMYQDIIDLLQDARTLYVSDDDQLLFDEAVKKYENLIREYKISTHPIKKWFYRKTYTRAIKKVVRKIIE